MKCPKCGIIVNTKTSICPLCHIDLLINEENKAEYISLEKAFATRKKKRPKQFSVFNKFFWIIACNIIIVSVVLNLIFTPTVLWGVLVIIALLYIYFLIRATIKDSKYLPHKVLGQAVGLSVLFYSFQAVINENLWAFEFVLPFIYMISMLIIVFYIFTKPSKERPFLISLAIVAILGLVPLVVVLLNDVEIKWPSIATACLSATMIISILLFGRKKIAKDIERNFHI